MAKYLFAYHGGGGMAATPEESKKVMDAWGAWFGSLGNAVVDGGNPVGPSATVSADGKVSEAGANSVSGYSLIEADSMEDALKKARGCPVLSNGGSVEVAEAIDM